MINPNQVLIIKQKQENQEIKQLSKAELEHLGVILQRDIEQEATEWQEITQSLIDKFGFLR